MEAKQVQLQNLIVFLLDCVCIVFSYVMASFLRFGNMWGGYTRGIVLFRLAVLVFGITLIYFTLFPNRDFFVRNLKQELRTVVINNMILGASVTIVAFLIQDAQEYSRMVYLLFCLIDVITMYLVHVLYKKYLTEDSGKRIGIRNILIITTIDRAESICNRIRENNAWNISVNGLIIIDEHYQKEIAGIPVVADGDSMIEYITKNVVDEVFIHLSSQVKFPLKKTITVLETMGIKVNLNINVFDMEIPGHKELEQIGGYYAVSFSPKQHSFKLLFLKRVMDICGAVIGLCITAVVTVFLAPILLLESPGPLFFSQTRIGKNGRRFKIYKFRSMYSDAEERKKELLEQNEMSGLMFKMENDPRVTKVGRFIRRTSIDELPQFWNVLKGEMSLVGTRPPTEDEFLQYEGYHKRRLSATPGLTGLWQVSGRSDTTDFEEIVKMDVEYIDTWSIQKDILIILKTIGVVFKGKGAC